MYATSVQGMSSKTFLKELRETFGQDEIIHRSTICLLTSGKNKIKNTEEDGQEEDDDDESILDPLADSRSTTPALPPHVAFIPAEELEKLNAEQIAEKIEQYKTHEDKNDAEWKAELVSIVEEEAPNAQLDVSDPLKKLNLE